MINSVFGLAWVKGGHLSVMFPEDKAYPLGGSRSEFKHFYFQFHNDTPPSNIIVNITIRFYITKDYRPIEFGVLTTGAAMTPLALTIPPGAVNMNIDFLCRKHFMNVNRLEMSE